jgi:hypothetical protein
MQTTHNRFEPPGQSMVAIPELIKREGLLYEYNENRIWGHASVDFGGDWVITEILPSAFRKLGQGNLEEGFEVGGSGGYVAC